MEDAPACSSKHDADDADDDNDDDDDDDDCLILQLFHFTFLKIIKC